MSELIKKDSVTPFAATNYHNERRVFGIKKDDRRRHMYIIGKTGMGKSTMLENLVYTDIQMGNGVCYVDPHGDTAEKILQWIPQSRIKDTIYFNPSDLDHPIAFNVLEKVDVRFRNNVASGLVSVYKKLWADSWGPRLEYILRYAILALLDYPDSSLLGINRILVDKPYREHVLSYVEDPVVKSFWVDEFSKWNDRVLAEVISPIQNKVGQFLSNSMIRNIVGQKHSTIDMRKIMDEKKILIMNLSKGSMGEDASALLGAMIITKIQLGAMSRVNIDEDDREDFYLYVDEFQNFATESFANILSEARKYRLCLTIAHQYIAQLESGTSTVVRDAVFGNVGTLITFRVGATDAEFLEKEFEPYFMIPDIVNLPSFKIYLRLMVNGVASQPFSADALPPLASKDFGHGQEVIDFTHKTYTRTRDEVIQEIKEWSQTDFSNKAGGGASEGGMGGGAETFHTGQSVASAYASATSKTSTDKKSYDTREIKPVVWNGHCDVCGKELGLSFTPDESRPIMCQDDLKLFRKGGLPTPKVEAMMMKVMERKAKQGQINKQTSKPVIPPSPKATAGVGKSVGGDFRKPKPVAPTINKPMASGSIKMVEKFSDESSKPVIKQTSNQVIKQTSNQVNKQTSKPIQTSNPSGLTSVKPGQKIEL